MMLRGGYIDWMSELSVIISILLIAFVGYLIIRGFRLLPNLSFLYILSYSYGFGVGVIALQMFLYARIGIAWNTISLLFPWAALFLIFLIKKRFKISYKPRLHWPGVNFRTVLLVAILLLLGFVVFESLLRPLTAWDGWASWLLKSKVFFVDGGMKGGVFTYMDTDYPIVIGMIGAFVYTMLGEVHDRAVLLLFASFYICLGGVLFYSLKEQFGVGKSLLFTFLLLSTQNLIRHGGRFEAGQADLALGYYFLVCVTLLLRYIGDKNYKTLLLLNIFLGITALIKNEGIPMSLCIAGVALWHVMRRKEYRQLFLFLFYFIPIIDWQVYKVIADIPKLPGYIQLSVYPERVMSIISEFLKELTNILNWNLLWFVFFYSVFIWSLQKKKRRTHTIVLFLILFQFCIYFLVFSVSRVEPTDHIRNVFDRLLIHIAPVAVVFISYISADILNSFQRIKKYVS
jgi:hypothetical protein